MKVRIGTDHVRAADLRLELSAPHFTVSQLVLHALHALEQTVVLLLGLVQRATCVVQALLQHAAVVLAAQPAGYELLEIQAICQARQEWNDDCWSELVLPPMCVSRVN